MQKLIQRSKLAEREVTRRKARVFAQRESDKIWEANMQKRDQRQHIRSNVMQERKARREDWEVGTRLAPRRDIGDRAEKYATVDQSMFSSPNVAKKIREKTKPWIAEGDRIVMLEGRDKGKIARVTSCDEDSQTVKVTGVNQVDFFVPEFMRFEDQDQRPVVPFSLNIPWSAVKLVHAVKDANGSFRDVIVERVEVRKPTWFEMRYKNADNRGKRMIPGLEQEVPWPTTDPENYTDNEADTLRITVDEVTDRPYLLQSPMPRSVVDELRNKYSRFRTRHDPEYVASKEALLAKEERKKLLGKLVTTPTMELRERNRRERAAAQGLTEEQLATIGEVMARERTAAVQKAAEVSAQS